MTEEQTEVLSTETIQVKENGDKQSPESCNTVSVPVQNGNEEEQSKNEIEPSIETQSFLVFGDADIPKCMEDVEIVTQDDLIGSQIHLDYYPDSILNQFEEELINLVELDVQTTELDDKALVQSTYFNIDEKIKIETIDISSLFPVEGIDVKSEFQESSLKRKGECVESGPPSIKYGKIYTIGKGMVTETPRERRRNRGNKIVSRLIDYQVQCVNLHCQSGYGLEAAPVFVLTYFGQTRKKNVLQKVCRECFMMAFRHQQDMIYRLKARKSILRANFPPQKNDVVIMDVIEEKYKEEQLPEEVVSQVRKYLPDLLATSLEKYHVNYQIDQACDILNERLQVVEDENKSIDDELNSLELTLREARLLIYKDFTPKIKQLPPLTIMDPPVKAELGFITNTVKIFPEVFKSMEYKSRNEFSNGDIISPRQVEILQKKLPPGGSLIYPLLTVGNQVYVMKISLLGLWVKGRIIEIIGSTPESLSYRVRYETSHRGGLAKLVSGKFLAYSKPSAVRYPVGTRVVALFRNKDVPSKSAYYVGMVAEPPRHLNKFRYLVFFDDGYAQYVEHEKIFLVCESSDPVYEDVHPANREFIKKYLERYPERPMVKLLKGQIVRTEWSGKWWVARVVELDCSLAKMHFDSDGRTEWIYRGSTRLGPLYSELVVGGGARREGSTVPRQRTEGIASLKKKNMPYVEYNVDLDDPNLPRAITGISKTVAKKNTSPNACGSDSAFDRNTHSPDVTHMMEYISKGYIRSMDVSQRIIGKTFVPHQCGPSCTKWMNYSESKCRGMSPLSIPIFYGFERQTIKHKTKRTVMYRAPCGRRLRTMVELHRYLRITKTLMGLDMFDFDYTIHVLDEFHLEKDMYRTHLKDISYGLEKNPISCVNEIDHSWPAFMDYSTSRIPQEGVKICYDDQFLVCCDCDDDCQDKSKCDCWQLTIEGTKPVHNGVADSSVGYKYKRLLEPVATGIYECNHKCKCASTCLNRVAQHPLQLNLQVFRTLKKGWGLRTVNDIPQGGFICIYAGRLHTEQSANDDGRMYGDEYLAELDYIEVVERFKEGYESEVIEPSGKYKEEEIEKKSVFKNDRDQIPESFRRLPPQSAPTETAVNTRTKNKKISMKENPKNVGEKLKGLFGEHASKVKQKEEKSLKYNSSNQAREERLKKYKSVREMYGDGADDCYIMDAKSIGNIGRYLNHSCQPNVFVQNVFVDSHDVRFPWVAFFALTHIRAGTELTWDYNYDVGSVPDKVLYCYCNKAECRGRLL